MTTATKRKSTGTSSRASKKSKKETASNTNDVAQALVSDILADQDGYAIPEDESDMRKLLVQVAQYARDLEGRVDTLIPKPKSAEELEAAAEKIRNAAVAGIKKQMSVRTCILSSCFFSTL